MFEIDKNGRIISCTIDDVVCDPLHTLLEYHKNIAGPDNSINPNTNELCKQILENMNSSIEEKIKEGDNHANT